MLYVAINYMICLYLTERLRVICSLYICLDLSDDCPSILQGTRFTILFMMIFFG